jgi:hypothetical protein
MLLDALCADGYLALETAVDVPPDCTGYSVSLARHRRTSCALQPLPTKIAILRATRKDGRAGDDLPSGAPRLRGAAGSRTARRLPAPAHLPVGASIPF